MALDEMFFLSIKRNDKKISMFFYRRKNRLIGWCGTTFESDPSSIFNIFIIFPGFLHSSGTRLSS
jgi:hypothetical protein